MSQQPKTIVDIINDLTDLRQYKGCLSRIDRAGKLWCAMGCESASANQKASSLIWLIQKCGVEENDYLAAEILLAALGLLVGYDKEKTVGARRKMYYELGFPEDTYKDVDSSITDYENRMIVKLAEKVVAGYSIPAIFVETPQELLLPTPRYYRINPMNSSIVDEEKTPFARYIDTEWPLPAAQSIFDYRADTIPFSFREKELGLINRFCMDERMILWWAIVGGGGSGKSRLAYQYMLTHNSDDWKILFLRDEFFTQGKGEGKYTKYDDWSYSQNLMLIVDCVQRHSAAVAQWIESVVAKKARERKIRILLIERTGEEGLWYGNFTQRSSIFACRFGCFLEISPLGRDELFSFAHEYANMSNAKISKKRIAAAISALKVIDKEERILFFILILHKYFDEKTGHMSTSRAQLMDYIIHQEIQNMEARFHGDVKTFRTYMQLLIIATATSEISITDPPDYLKDKCDYIFANLLPSSSAKKAMAIAGDNLYPFTPDPIGEYLVLTKLEEYFPLRADQRWFSEIAWTNFPKEYSSFLIGVSLGYHSEKDLMSTAWLKEALRVPKSDNSSAHYACHYIWMLSHYFEKDYGRFFVFSRDEYFSAVRDLSGCLYSNNCFKLYVGAIRQICCRIKKDLSLLSWAVEGIRTVIDDKIDQPEIIKHCVCALNDICMAQLTVHEKIGIIGICGEDMIYGRAIFDKYIRSYHLHRTPLRFGGAPYLEILKAWPSEDSYEIIAEIANVIAWVLDTDTYSMDEDILLAFMHAFINIANILSLDYCNQVLEELGQLAEKHNSVAVWADYAFILAILASKTGFEEKKERMTQAILNITNEHLSDNALGELYVKLSSTPESERVKAKVEIKEDHKKLSGMECARTCGRL